MDIQKELDDRYDSIKVYEPFVTVLNGSQNYDLDDEDSDIDTYTYVFPTFTDIVEGNHMLAKEIVCADGSHNNLKDVRLMVPMLQKAGINSVEMLFTDYYKVNEQYADYWKAIRDNRSAIANYDRYRTVMSALGGLQSADLKVQKAADRGKVDGKALSKVLYLHYFIYYYVGGSSYEQCIKPSPNDRDRILRIKRNKSGLTPDEAVRISLSNKDSSLNLIEKNTFQTSNKGVKYFLDTWRRNLIYDYLKNHISKE